MKNKSVFKIGIVILFLSIFSVSCSEDNADTSFTIDYSKLPVLAKEFVATYFSEADVLSVRQMNETQSDGTLYKVSMKNGGMIDFNNTGGWITVASANLPWAIFSTSATLSKIEIYIKENYAEGTPVAIQKRQDTKIQVDLLSNDHLLFDAGGNFLSKS